MKRNWVQLVVFIVAWVSMLHLTFFFTMFWINGSVWIGEDNIVVRSIESIMLAFSLVYFSGYLARYTKRFICAEL